MKSILLAALFALAATHARAQGLTNLFQGGYSPTDFSTTSLGTAPLLIVPQPAVGTKRQLLSILLNTAGQMSCTFNGMTPTSAGAGTRTYVNPGAAAGYHWETPGYVPQGPVTCVGSTTGMSVTAEAAQ